MYGVGVYLLVIYMVEGIFYVVLGLLNSCVGGGRVWNL